MRGRFTGSYCLLLLLILLGSTVSAQSYFQKVFQSSPYNQEAQDVLPTSDGGFLIAGYTTNATQYDCDVLVIKTDASGSEKWRKTYGGPRPDFPYHMLQTSDGNYFLIGYSQSHGNGDYDILLLKISPTGTLLWEKTYGSYGNDIGQDIIKTSDGNYIIVASSNSDDYNDQNVNVIKINPSGNILWSKYYGGNNDDYGICIKQTNDGGYIVSGITMSFGQDGDAYLIKLNANGDVTWTKTYGDAHYDEGSYVETTSDGGYVLLIRDSTSSNDIDISLIKTDQSGNFVWSKLFGGSKKDTPKMIQKTSDGGYIIAGHSRSFGWINPDMWILKCNESGDTTWTRHYGGYDHEHCYVVRELNEGGFIAAGKTASFGFDFDPIFLKINPAGKITVGVDEYFASKQGDYFFPNPATNEVTVSNKSGDLLKLLVTDVSGKVVCTIIPNLNDHFNVNISSTPAGVYFLTWIYKNESATQRLIIK